MRVRNCAGWLEEGDRCMYPACHSKDPLIQVITFLKKCKTSCGQCFMQYLFTRKRITCSTLQGQSCTHALCDYVTWEKQNNVDQSSFTEHALHPSKIHLFPPCSWSLTLCKCVYTDCKHDIFLVSRICAAKRDFPVLSDFSLAYYKSQICMR